MQQKPEKNHRRAWGIGLGFGLAGAFALALRHKFLRQASEPVPEDLSPAIFARRMAATAHGDMVYHISGSGDPLVFVHGLYPGASSFEWSRVYPQFVMERETLAADLLGFGESERTDRVTDASELAESLADFLREALPGCEPVLVASGLSAPIVLLAAARHPERVKALVLLDAQSPNQAPAWSTPSLRLLSKIPGPGSASASATIGSTAFFQKFLSMEGTLPDTLMACSRQAGARHLPLRILRGALRFDIDARIERIMQPVTLLGRKDSPSPFESKLLERIPGAVFYPLGLSESPLPALTDPDAVAATLRQALCMNPPFENVA
jgi:pimeloyl-ACP methyl ester carboxylesterase